MKISKVDKSLWTVATILQTELSAKFKVTRSYVSNVQVMISEYQSLM